MSLPPGVKESKCKSCGAPILWASTHRGRSMPVDLVPTAAGDFVSFVRKGKVEVEKFDARYHDQAAPRRTSHFATCPNAKEHRQ